jgi:hypothetical protein
MFEKIASTIIVSCIVIMTVNAVKTGKALRRDIERAVGKTPKPEPAEA